jgi:hypothetical protein
VAKPAETSRRREAPAPAPPETRATADRRLRILERLTGLAVAHIARDEEFSVQRIRRIIAQTRESREIGPPAGFVQLRIARLSVDRGAHDDDGGRSARDGSIDRADGRTRPLSWLREAAGFACRGGLAAAAPSGAAKRIAGAEFRAVGSRDENFPGCKALKSHETELESVDWSLPSPFFTGRRRGHRR